MRKRWSMSGLPGVLRQERLDGDDAAVRVVLGAVDLAHAAGAELLEDAEPPEALAASPRRRGRGVPRVSTATRVLARLSWLSNRSAISSSRAATFAIGGRSSAERVSMSASRPSSGTGRFGGTSLVSWQSSPLSIQHSRPARAATSSAAGPLAGVGQQPRAGVVRPGGEIDLDRRRGALRGRCPATGRRGPAPGGAPPATGRASSTATATASIGGQRQASRERLGGAAAASLHARTSAGGSSQPEVHDAASGGVLEESGPGGAGVAAGAISPGRRRSRTSAPRPACRRRGGRGRRRPPPRRPAGRAGSRGGGSCASSRRTGTERERLRTRGRSLRALRGTSGAVASGRLSRRFRQRPVDRRILESVPQRQRLLGQRRAARS